ncbi:hypothetical protein ABVF61_19635 [Roseibium sp. HPY-6]|uniref:hypothetical protein n=1 Tax=Roseibium sp. HPY-6 TaxID=3229852 RepID=UPI00338EB17E
MAWYAKFDGVDGSLDATENGRDNTTQGVSKEGNKGGQVETTWKIEEGEANVQPLGLAAGDAGVETALARGKAVIEPETLQVFEAQSMDQFNFAVSPKDAQPEPESINKSEMVDVLVPVDQEAADYTVWRDGLGGDAEPEAIVPHYMQFDDVIF